MSVFCLFYVSRVGHFVFVATSDDIFASPTGLVHPVHCFTRADVRDTGGEGD